MAETATQQVTATLFVADENGDEYWCEDERGHVEIEATDNNSEIRIGLHARARTSEAAGIYLTREEAIQAAALLARALADLDTY